MPEKWSTDGSKLIAPQVKRDDRQNRKPDSDKKIGDRVLTQRKGRSHRVDHDEQNRARDSSHDVSRFGSPTVTAPHRQFQVHKAKNSSSQSKRKNACKVVAHAQFTEPRDLRDADRSMS